MGAFAAQFEFSAEIVAFLVGLTGIALVVLRGPQYVPGRLATATAVCGFGALAASAFIHGAITPDVGDPAAVVALRLASALLLGAVGFLVARARVRGVRVGQSPGSWIRLEPALVGAAAGLLALAGPVSYLSLDAAETLLLAAALALGASLVRASWGSVGARLTANAAATLVLIVVVLSVAISSVLSNTVRNDALHRLQSQAAAVAASASTSWVANLREAKLLAASVEGLGLDAPAAAGSASGAAALQAGLSRLSTEFFSDVALEWVVPPVRVGAVSPNFDSDAGPGVAAALAASQLVDRAVRTGTPGGTAGVAVGRALAVAAYPDVDPASHHVLGVAVVVTRLGTRFLDQQLQADASLSGAIVAGGRVLSSLPRTLHLPAPVLSLAGAALAGGHPSAVTAGSVFAAASPVPVVSGPSVLAAVVQAPTAEVDGTRESLFRTLFLIALGGSLIAFLLSVLVSDRLNRGFDRLTSAARRISTGETLVRTGLVSEDEIGTLAEAFDSMAESIEEQAAALRQAAGRLQSVVAGMGEGLVALDEGGAVTELNPAAERLLGRPRADALGRPASVVADVRLEDGHSLWDLLSEAQAFFDGRGSVVRESGPVPVALSARGLDGAVGAAGGTVVLLRDLRSEQAVERMKTEFLSRVGHELRTPLTAILGFGKLLARRSVPPEQASVLHDQILEQSNRLLRTVQMLEFFASAGADRLALVRRALPVTDLLNDAAARWAPRMDASHRLVVRVPRRLPDVEVDPRSVALAMDELIDNAVKFSPSGGQVTLSVSVADGLVRLQVDDHGQGLSEEEMLTAFQEFVQGDSSDTRRFGGLGLGLALVRTVADAHGGRVDVKSTPGRGSTFSLILPTTAPGRSDPQE